MSGKRRDNYLPMVIYTGTRRSGAALLIFHSMLSARFLSSVQSFAPHAGRQVVVGSAAARWSRLSATRTALFSTLSGSETEELNARIKAKGDEIRDLKAAGIGKAEIAPHIDELLALKAQVPAPATEVKPKTATKEKAVDKKPLLVKKNVEEMSESELRLNRLGKVEAMREIGVEPFEYTYETTHTAVQLAELYEGKLEPGEEDEEADVGVAGRVMTRRVFGKLAFFTLQDETGIIQLQFDKSRLGDSFKVRHDRCSVLALFTRLLAHH